MSSVVGSGAERAVPVVAQGRDHGSEAWAPRGSGCGITFARRLEAFAGVWPALGDEGDFTAHFFQRREWVEVWAAAVSGRRGVRTLFVRVDNEEGKPLLLLPLAIEKRRGVRMLTFLDAGVGCVNAPVLFPGASELGERAMAELWRRLCTALPPFDMAILSHMPYALGGVANPLRRLPCRPMRRPPGCCEQSSARRSFAVVARTLKRKEVEALTVFVENRDRGAVSAQELLEWATGGNGRPSDDDGSSAQQDSNFAWESRLWETPLWETPLPLLQASLPVTLAGRAVVGAVRARQSLAQSQVGRAYGTLRMMANARRTMSAMQKFRRLGSGGRQ